MAKREIKIQLTQENYEFLISLKKSEGNSGKTISDLINENITEARELVELIGEFLIS